MRPTKEQSDAAIQRLIYWAWVTLDDLYGRGHAKSLRKSKRYGVPLEDRAAIVITEGAWGDWHLMAPRASDKVIAGHLRQWLNEIYRGDDYAKYVAEALEAGTTLEVYLAHDLVLTLLCTVGDLSLLPRNEPANNGRRTRRRRRRRSC